MTTEKDSRPVSVALRSAILLGVFAVLGGGLVALTFDLTRDRIADNRQRVLLRRLHEILPSETYDNALHADTLRVSSPLLGPVDQSSTVYRARRNGQPVAVILEVTAPDGYSGAIHLLVGIDTLGRVAGVRTVSHSETPGLGDDIELARSDWVLDFNGRSLEDPPPDEWAVRRDGGVFDQFTGATITPRAVVKAIRNALLYFRDHREQLFDHRTTDA